jgi:hypothetical protein
VTTDTTTVGGDQRGPVEPSPLCVWLSVCAWSAPWDGTSTRALVCVAAPARRRSIHFIYLDAGQREELDELLARRREKQAVGINGGKWAVGYRVIFPGEARWRPLLNNLEL